MEKKDKKSGRNGRGLDTIGKRILVLTIAILMTFQFCTPSLTGISFAEEITDVTEEELSAATAETAVATEEVQEEAQPQEEVTETVLEETESFCPFCVPVSCSFPSDVKVAVTPALVVVVSP